MNNVLHNAEKKSKTSIIGFKLKADKCITFFIQLEVKIFINVFSWL